MRSLVHIEKLEEDRFSVTREELMVDGKRFHNKLGDMNEAGLFGWLSVRPLIGTTPTAIITSLYVGGKITVRFDDGIGIEVPWPVVS